MTEYIFNDEIVDNDNLPKDIKPYSDGRPIYKVTGELIRCKNCKYFSTDLDRNNRCDLYMDAYSPWAESQYSPSENDFCSQAEKKEE